MLVIRLTRVGKKNQPSFRVVLTEKTNPVRGKFIEILGNYNPRLKTKALKAERIKYWLSKGAQPSATVHNLLVSENIISGPKVKAWRPKKKTQEAKVAAVKVVAEAKTVEGTASTEGAKAEEAKAKASVEAVAEEVKTEI